MKPNFVPTPEQFKVWCDERSKADRASSVEWDHARLALLKEYGPASRELKAFDHVRQSPDLTTYKRLMAHIRGPSFDGRVGNEAGQLLGKMRTTVLGAIGIDPACRVCVEDRGTHGPLWPGPGWWAAHGGVSAGADEDAD